ncbi:uncharacterized protein LOC135167724 [Diachasmimorpha longicaudata]|uniref:uncharacterized protein LOC135167724 n=1 Tax=Diachasmimorpha longicaudata TaxID=58733 RepID=UPI0030B89330
MESHAFTSKLPEASEKRLPRAISFSELPTRRRVIIQQAEVSGELVRQYSCEQIYDKASNTRQINFITSVTSKLNPKISHWKPPSENISWHQRLASLSLQPKHHRQQLEIDNNSRRTSNSPNKPSQPRHRSSFGLTSACRLQMTPPEASAHPSGQSPPDIPEKSLEFSERTTKLRPLISTEFSKPVRRGSTMNKLIFFGLMSALVLIVSTLISDYNQKPLDFTNTTAELRKNVLGQTEAVETLVGHFQSNFDDFTVVILLGGIGVGKTYTANIIKHNFPYKNNIFEYYAPITNPIASAYESLSHFLCNLVIVENMKTEDAKDFVNFAKFIQGQETRPCMIILGVLNPQVTDDGLKRTMDLEKTNDELVNLFREEGIKGTVVRFDSLGPEIIGECVMREVRDTGMTLADGDYEAIKSQLLRMDCGCKGVRGKMHMYIKKDVL